MVGNVKENVEKYFLWPNSSFLSIVNSFLRRKLPFYMEFESFRAFFSVFLHHVPRVVIGQNWTPLTPPHGSTTIKTSFYA